MRQLPFLAIMLSIGTGVFMINFSAPERGAFPKETPTEAIRLPEPRHDSATSVEKALLQRRSIRNYAAKSLNLAEVSQLLWAAQGITDRNEGLRTAPSAGALYPLEVYVAAGNVQGLAPGLYRYRPAAHDLQKTADGDLRQALGSATPGQDCVEEGAAVFVISAVFERTARKYGERAGRYVHMEVGHAAQNLYLQATALNLGTVVVGAFRDEAVKRVMNLPAEEEPLYLIPVGHPGQQ